MVTALSFLLTFILPLVVCGLWLYIVALKERHRDEVSALRKRLDDDMRYRP